MLDYRIKVANFLRFNHIPMGLGQYKLVKVKSIEHIEWMCAARQAMKPDGISTSEWKV